MGYCVGFSGFLTLKSAAQYGSTPLASSWSSGLWQPLFSRVSINDMSLSLTAIIDFVRVVIISHRFECYRSNFFDAKTLIQISGRIQRNLPMHFCENYSIHVFILTLICTNNIVYNINNIFWLRHFISRSLLFYTKSSDVDVLLYSYIRSVTIMMGNGKGHNLIME